MYRETRKMFIHIHLKLVENVFPCYVKKNYLLYFLEITHWFYICRLEI